jgi:hypothetical protein
VFVGPNNAGKSVALREIQHLLNRTPLAPGQHPKVVREIDIQQEGTVQELRDWVEQHAVKEERGFETVYKSPTGGEIAWSSMEANWAQAGGALNYVTPMVTFSAAADGRLGLASSSPSYDVMRETPSTPLQLMVLRPEIEEELSEVARQAFGVGLTLNRASGSQLHLHVGTTDIKPVLPPQHAYLDALRRMPLVQDQGDGVRSFVGLMIALTAARYPLIFVDEPEAFLHPPQARLLGGKLASEVPDGTQIFVATHSMDVLQGLLNEPETDVTIVRLVRDGDINPASVLPPDQVKQLWKDPLLRYSNVLDGLFHRGVVVCEADSDARFYAAVLDANRAKAGLGPHDLLFTHCGGKQRMPVVIDALRAVNVPVAVVADFDVMRERPLLERLYSGLGGVWSELSDDWSVVRAAIEGMGTAPLLATTKERVDEILAASVERGPRLRREDAEQIRNATKVDDGWAAAKRGGLAVLPGGDASDRATRLLATLAKRGLFVVEVGELERWAPKVGGHGPQWVVEVLSRAFHAQPEFPAGEWIRRVDQYLEA